MSSPVENSVARPSTEETATEGEPSKSPMRLGAVVDRYVVLEEVGRGAVGVVYAAYDPRLDRRVALKVLEQGAASEQARTRMQREAQALARLAHPNVVTVFDVALAEGQVCIAMEYLDGGPLDRWLQASTRPWREILAVFIAAGRGLAAAHAAGIVHRDFKPSNVVVTGDGRVKVTDFGLARGTSSLELPQTPLITDSAESVIDVQLTAPGSLVGTAAFMAAEQFETGAGSPAADQFSFCVSLYRGLYGVAPFPGKTPFEILQNVSESQPRPPPSTAAVPRRLEQAVMRGLARDPDERHPSMDALLDALESTLSARRGRFVVAGAAVAIVGTAVAFAVTGRSDPCEDVGAPMSEAWNDAREAEVADALHRIEVTYADQASAAVADALDAYASAWVEERTNACALAHSSASTAAVPADQTIACLERGRDHVAAIVEVLVDADLSIAASAVTLVDSVEDPHRCSDPRRAIARARLVADAREWPEAESVRSQIARGRARTNPERADEAAAILSRALGDAQEIADPALEAEARLRLAKAYDSGGEAARAVAELERAVELAIASGADEIAAEASATLLVIDGDNLRNLERGRIWELQVHGYLARFGDDPRLRLSLESALALFASTEGRYEEALRRIDGLEEIAAAMPSDQFRLLLNRGVLFQRAERRKDAVRAYRAAVAYGRAAFGDEHPSVAIVMSRLATELAAIGQGVEAERLQREALAIRRRHASAIAIAESLSDLGVTLARDDNWQGALELTEEARDLLLREAPEHGYLINVRHNVANCLRYVGRETEALAEHEAVLRMERARGYKGVSLLMSIASLAQTKGQLGDPHGGLELLQEAERYAEELSRPNILRVKLFHVKAELLSGAGRAQEAFDAMLIAFDELEGADASPSERTDVLEMLVGSAMALR